MRISAQISETPRFPQLTLQVIEVFPDGSPHGSPAPTAPELNENEQKAFAAVRSDDATTIDEVIRASGLPSSTVSVALLGLEMKRLVRQLPGKLFVRNV